MKEVKKNELKLINETEAPAELAVLQGDWGNDGLDADDFIFPRIKLCQSNSDILKQKGTEVRQGDFYNNQTNLGLGDELELIIFSVYKTWKIFKTSTDKNGKKNSEYVKTELYTPENSTLPYNEIINGESFHRDAALNFFAIDCAQIARGEGVIPYKIEFTKTGLREGQKISSFLTQFKSIGKSFAYKAMKLNVRLEKNDAGSWFAPLATLGKLSTVEELKEAKKWYDFSNANKEKLKASVVAAEEAAKVEGDIKF